MHNLPLSVKGKSKRRISRVAARRVSLIRDTLASVKDGGLILAVLALLLFHDQVGEYLSSIGLIRSDISQVVDLQQGLLKLNQAVETQPILDPDESMKDVVKAHNATTLSRKALRVEQRILKSEDAAFVNDWTVVFATATDKQVAMKIQQEYSGKDSPAFLAKKGGRFKVFFRTESPEATQSALNKVRVKHPYAISASLKSWCNPRGVEAGVENCSGP